MNTAQGNDGLNGKPDMTELSLTTEFEQLKEIGSLVRQGSADSAVERALAVIRGDSSQPGARMARAVMGVMAADCPERAAEFGIRILGGLTESEKMFTRGALAQGILDALGESFQTQEKMAALACLKRPAESAGELIVALGGERKYAELTGVAKLLMERNPGCAHMIFAQAILAMSMDEAGIKSQKTLLDVGVARSAFKNICARQAGEIMQIVCAGTGDPAVAFGVAYMLTLGAAQNSNKGVLKACVLAMEDMGWRDEAHALPEFVHAKAREDESHAEIDRHHELVGLYGGAQLLSYAEGLECHFERARIAEGSDVGMHLDRGRDVAIRLARHGPDSTKISYLSRALSAMGASHVKPELMCTLVEVFVCNAPTEIKWPLAHTGVLGVLRAGHLEAARNLYGRCRQIVGPMNRRAFDESLKNSRNGRRVLPEPQPGE